MPESNRLGGREREAQQGSEEKRENKSILRFQIGRSDVASPTSRTYHKPLPQRKWQFYTKMAG
jgi:hypothetical protein